MSGGDRPAYTGPLKAVVLDWAGTTVDYGSCAPAGVFVEVFRRRGVDVTIEEARAPMGAGKRDHIAAMAAMEPVAARWQAKHGRAVTDDDIDSMYQEFARLQLACIADYADLIPGTLDAVADFRRRGLKIGTTTGYTREMMDVLVPEAEARGFHPDSIVCVSDVPAGRPAPWMCYLNAINLQVYPLEACVKVGDTIADIDEGLNAGTWTVGVAKTGNEIGLPEDEVAALQPDDLASRLKAAYDRMHAAGAHYVVDGIGDVPALLDEIGERLARGERP